MCIDPELLAGHKAGIIIGIVGGILAALSYRWYERGSK